MDKLTDHQIAAIVRERFLAKCAKKVKTKQRTDRIAEQVNDKLHQGVDSSYCVVHVDADEPTDGKEKKK